MDKMMTPEAAQQRSEPEPMDYKAAVAEILAQINEIDERIQRNQAETEQFRAETQVMLTQMQAQMQEA